MLWSFASFKTLSVRRAAMAGAVALAAAMAFMGNTAPAAAFGSFHHHAGFGGFHHRFGFVGPGFFPGYYDDYAAADGCLRRI
jgi:hypothetical protein